MLGHHMQQSQEESPLLRSLESSLSTVEKDTENVHEIVKVN